MSDHPPLRFLFDFISPYAYLAWTQIHALAEKHGRTVEPVPILFAALLNAHGHKGPAEIPPKRIYILKDAFRKAHRLGVPIGGPPTHPFNPLLALRASSLPLPPEARRALIDGLFNATWGGGGAGIEDPREVAAIASRAGLDGAHIVEGASSAEAKARLREQSDAAIAAGVFGVPTIVADGELFWGVDSLEHLDAFLRGEDPVDPEALNHWMTITASAARIRPQG